MREKRERERGEAAVAHTLSLYYIKRTLHFNISTLRYFTETIRKITNLEICLTARGKQSIENASYADLSISRTEAGSHDYSLTSKVDYFETELNNARFFTRDVKIEAATTDAREKESN